MNILIRNRSAVFKDFFPCLVSCICQSVFIRIDKNEKLNRNIVINPFNFQKGPLTARRKKINLSCVFSFEIIRHVVIIISRKVFSKVKNHLSENTQIIQWLKCPLTNFSYYVSLKKS